MRVPTTVSLGTGVLPPTLPTLPGRPRPIIIEKPVTDREIKRADSLLAKRDFRAVLSEGLLERVAQLTPLWSGTVTLSENRMPGRRYRLVIAEYEEYIVDDATPYERPDTAKERRLVFVEHVELA